MDDNEGLLDRDVQDVLFVLIDAVVRNVGQNPRSEYTHRLYRGLDGMHRIIERLDVEDNQASTDGRTSRRYRS